MKPIYILGTGSYLPEKVLSNFDLEKIMDTSDEWIRQRTGIKERREAAPDQAVSDLALPACLTALDEAGLRPDEVEVIILGTITPDTHCPAAANWLQAKLDAPQALTFDVTAACSGFIFSLHVAEKYLLSGFCENVLVVASEVMTRTLDWSDRGSSILWGDGAGVAVLSTKKGKNSHRVLSVHAHSDGANGQNLLMPGGGSNTTPISYESVDKKLHYLRLIEANYTMRVAVKHFTDSCREAVKANNVGLEDVAWFIPHQANLRIVQAVAKRLKVDMERFYMTIHKYGNISSASCAITLDEAAKTGAIKKDDLVCLTTFGGGLTWASSLIRW
ncbi:MAG: beta-ketoacyl-ACP synthase III [Thermodesulfobacteriota bacterium]|nr:beta-ketoacyl-ACP synthase III [Thermodesulfobacteriota bacterium]